MILRNVKWTRKLAEWIFDFPQTTSHFLQDICIVCTILKGNFDCLIIIQNQPKPFSVFTATLHTTIFLRSSKLLLCEPPELPMFPWNIIMSRISFENIPSKTIFKPLFLRKSYVITPGHWFLRKSFLITPGHFNDYWNKWYILTTGNGYEIFSSEQNWKQVCICVGATY